MEYYDTEAHATREIAKRIIPLEGCHALSQTSAMKSKKYVFDFTTKQGRMVFATDSQEELDDWMKSIKTAVQFDLEARKRQKMRTTLPDQPSATSIHSMEVENDMYESTQTGRGLATCTHNNESPKEWFNQIINVLGTHSCYMQVHELELYQLIYTTIHYHIAWAN